MMMILIGCLALPDCSTTCSTESCSAWPKSIVEGGVALVYMANIFSRLLHQAVGTVLVPYCSVSTTIANGEHSTIPGLCDRGAVFVFVTVILNNNNVIVVNSNNLIIDGAIARCRHDFSTNSLWVKPVCWPWRVNNNNNNKQPMVVVVQIQQEHIDYYTSM
jgi:hypothetical protein